MIVVLGDVDVLPDRFEDALALSHVHVERSRSEPGCVSHDVLTDPQRPNRLVFVERWQDRATLDQHFGVPESIAFAQALTEFAATPPSVQVLPILPR